MEAAHGFWLAFLLLLSCEGVEPQTSASATDQVAGVWRGHSVCMVKNSPCRDELNVYRISAIPEKPSTYLVSGNKMAGGNEVVMGTGEWKYDASAHELVYEFPRGLFQLKLQGDKLDGDLKLPDGTVYRQIFLQREE